MFLIMGDEKYSHTIEYSVQTLNRIYPGKEVLLLDWGLSDKSMSSIKNANGSVTIKKWNLFEQKTSSEKWFLLNMIISHFHPNQLRETASYHWQAFKKFIKGDSSMSLLKFEKMILEKIKCFNYASDYFDGPFLFLDADAILVKGIPELFCSNYDIAVTLRRESELNYRKGQCRLLNSGVIFFGRNKKIRALFIQKWFNLATTIHESIAEQTALSRIVLGFGDKSISHNDVVQIPISEENVCVKILSCENYNFNWIEEVLDEPAKERPEIKVLHFKGGRHARSQFHKLASKVIHEIV